MSSNSTNDAVKKEEAIIQNIQTGQNRAFYGSKNVHFKNITIDGIEQGEGAFAECRNITIEDTHIFLNYSLWHCYNIALYKIILEPNTRSSIWNCQNIEIVNCKINTVKGCRNCSNITLKDCIINSEDFGWKCEGVKIINLMQNICFNIQIILKCLIVLLILKIASGMQKMSIVKIVNLLGYI